jgi:hypothetical protein
MWCEIWSLTLREQHRLQVVENRVLRRIFGPRRQEVAEGWRRLHDEELHSLYASQNIMMMIKSRTVRLLGHAACMGEMRNAYIEIFIGKPGGKRPR